MRYLSQHIAAIIDSYSGNVPLAHFLKNYFRQYPKLGSRDRKILSALAYSWYRVSKGIEGREWLDMLLTELVGNPSTIQNFPLDKWIRENTSIHFNPDTLFPFDIALSAGITQNEWVSSMLVQPDLFIRIRKDKEKITGILSDNNIPYHFITDTCLALPNGAKIDTLLPEDSYVVQDALSQKTGSFLNPSPGQHWYDCCSGAGGKSLLLRDMQPTVQLDVSDIRESILSNLVKRFRQYHHPSPNTHILDAADQVQLSRAFGKDRFDGIICDVPCTGSGTWARTPEQMFFFDPSALKEFSERQLNIAANVAGLLKPGGCLYYITCSVFRQENEDVINGLVTRTGLQQEQAQLINGTGMKADSMFIAVLKKHL